MIGKNKLSGEIFIVNGLGVRPGLVRIFIDRS